MSTRDKVALALTIVVAIAAISFIFYLSATERQLAESQAKVRKSERVVFYEMLAAQGDSADTEKQNAPLAQATPQLAASLRSARETIAAYAELFKRKSAWLEGTAYDLPLIFFSPSARSRHQLPDPPAAPQELIEQIDQTARLGGPVCTLDFSDIDKVDIIHLGDINDCAILMEEYANARLASGDFPEALRGFLAVMNLADALEDEPLILSQGYRWKIYASMPEYLDYNALTPDLATVIVDRLARADNRDGLREALSGELQQQLTRFEDWKKESFASLVDDVGLYWGTRSWLWARPMCRPWFNKDQQLRIEMITRMLEVPDLPYYHVKSTLDQIEADINGLPCVNVTAQKQARWYLRAFSWQANFESTLDVIQLRIAIEQYHAKHGNYPETLDAVADWFGGTLPLDPFTGNPYPYELGEDDSYILSVPRLQRTPNAATRETQDSPPVQSSASSGP
jgi:hypothetical protein